MTVNSTSLNSDLFLQSTGLYLHYNSPLQHVTTSFQRRQIVKERGCYLRIYSMTAYKLVIRIHIIIDAVEAAWCGYLLA